MDSSAVSWLSEMGLDNPIFTDQFDFTDPFDEELGAVLGKNFENCLSPGKLSSWPSFTLIDIPRSNSITSLSISPITSSPTTSPQKSSIPPTKQQKPNNYSNFSTPDRAAASTPIILNFGDAYSPENPQQVNPRPLNRDEEAAVSEILRPQGPFADPEERSKRAQNVKRTTRVRPPSQTYDHIIAERKRREQLSQRFIALSTIVPGLKKTDKTSVLGDAIKYLKYLQERVKILEEQATKKNMESVVLVKKSHIITAEDEGSDKSRNFKEEEQLLPEIEARVCNSQMLIRVHCESQKGILINLISKVEKLNLNIVNANVASFGRMVLDITVITEMEKEFNMTVNEVVQKLRADLQPRV